MSKSNRYVVKHELQETVVHVYIWDTESNAKEYPLFMYEGDAVAMPNWFERRLKITLEDKVRKCMKKTQDTVDLLNSREDKLLSESSVIKTHYEQIKNRL